MDTKTSSGKARSLGNVPGSDSSRTRLCVLFLTQLGLVCWRLSRVSERSQPMSLFFFVLSQYNVFLSSLLNHGVTRWLRRIRLLTDAYVSIAIKQLLLLTLENYFRSCCNSYCCVSCESRSGKRALAFRHPEELWRLVLLQQLQLLLLSRQTLQLLLTPLPQWYL